MSDPALAIDPGLLRRFRDAGSKVSWRILAPGSGGGRRSAPRARIARLHEEEARIEEHPMAGGPILRVESGPVGALVLLLEIDRRGKVPGLISLESGVERAFPAGAIEANWGTDGPARSTVTVGDLVEVARYALV